MRGRLCGKLHGGRSQLLFALHQSSIDSQLFVENRHLCLPHLHSMPSLRGGGRRNIAMTFGVEKLEWCIYQTMRKKWKRKKGKPESSRKKRKGNLVILGEKALGLHHKIAWCD